MWTIVMLTCPNNGLTERTKQRNINSGRIYTLQYILSLLYNFDICCLALL